MKLYYRKDDQLLDVFDKKTCTTEHLIQCLLFVDDMVLCAESGEDLQRLMTTFGQESTKYGLSISNQKTKVLVLGHHDNVNHNPLEEVKAFKCLRSKFSQDITLDKPGVSFPNLIIKETFSFAQS